LILKNNMFFLIFLSILAVIFVMAAALHSPSPSSLMIKAVRILALAFVITAIAILGIFMLVAMVCGTESSSIFLPLIIILVLIGITLVRLMFKKTTIINNGSEQITNINTFRGNKQILLTNDQMALVKYVNENKARGVKNELILSALKDSGWADDEISFAMSYSKNV